MCYQSFFPSQIGIFQTHPVILGSTFSYSGGGSFDPRLLQRKSYTDSRVSPSTPLRQQCPAMEPRTEIEEEEKDASKRESDVETHPLASPGKPLPKSHVVTRSQVR